MSNDPARPRLNSVRLSPPADDGIRKTAILIESLDQPTAEILFGQLSLELAAQVRVAMLALGEVDPHEREQVWAEFLDAGLQPAPESEAGEAASATAEKFSADFAPVVAPAVDHAPLRAAGNEPFRVDASLGDAENPRHRVTGLLSCFPRHDGESESPPADASTAVLVRGLAHEHAQTICLVMAHLPPQQAADLLQRLPPARQAEVLERLAQLETATPEVIHELGEALQPWGFTAPSGLPEVCGRSPPAEPGFPTAAEGHPEHAAAGQTRPPSRALEYPDRLTVCAADPGEMPPLAEFDDLVRLDDAALARVFGAAEAETVLLALSGANRDLIDRIVRHLPSSAGRTLRRQLETLGPTRLRDIELAQQQLAELAGQMCREGLIHVPSRRRFTMAA